MSSSPFFTVCIPTFNRSQMLQRSVSHLLKQTCQDFEVLIGDNCSTDETQEVAGKLRDDRLKYYRHPQNIGAIANFRYLTDRARGEFVIIHQDDDLLHRNFLANCYQVVSSTTDITLYATPWWRGNLNKGFTSRLFRNPDQADFDYVAADTPLILDGRVAAVSLLHSFYFAHPALAFRSSTLAAVGGYDTSSDNINDVITEVNVLCRGKLAYDPRIGGVFTDHSKNTSRTMLKRLKYQMYENMYRNAVEALEANGVDWRKLLTESLARYTDQELLAVCSEWARYRAPKRLQLTGWASISKRPSLGGTRRITKVCRKVGWANVLRAGRVMLAR